MDYPNTVKSSDIVGIKVKSLEGKYIGEVNELIINKLSGKVGFVVVDFGGILGFGNKYFTFPWPAFNYSLCEDCYILDADIDLIKNTIGFDTEQWPNFHAVDLEKYYQ
ncbi:MAG: PRC-barrel domain-containing protein [bacterium]|nr:PRC-barrel domain-containing protein [bacterium]